MNSNTSNVGPLISAKDLAQRTATAELLVVDCRHDLADLQRGAREYAQGHIPGAIYADLQRDLADLSKHGQGRHPLPDAAAFSALLGSWGWRPGLPVVAYDAANGALAAARLWWMLRLIGEQDVAVLDGGLAAWSAGGFPLSDEPAQRSPSRVDVQFDTDRVVYTGQLQQLRKSPQVLLVDARAAPRYRGEVEPIDPVAGHVPGALNRPFSENLLGDGRFKPAAQLRAEFIELLGAHQAGNVVHMCGSGVTACHNLLAMEYAGLSGARIYAPSWSGWIDDPARPVKR
jgi:thiosulfate/3-mercaptopyruvate sulfurtransferase